MAVFIYCEIEIGYQIGKLSKIILLKEMGVLLSASQ
jgi:hypothetical protein